MFPHRLDEDRLITLTHQSSVLRGNPLGDPCERALHLLLPPGYHEEESRRYPVIWILAPFTSWGTKLFNVNAWDENLPQRADRLLSDGDCPPCIMAFPDLFTRYGGSQYLNSPATGRYEDYLIKELVPAVDEALRTLPDRVHRGVMGYSSGGFGALRMAMSHPDLFGAAVSHSGDMGFDRCYLPDFAKTARALENYGGLDSFLSTFTTMRRRGADWHNAISVAAMSACYSPDDKQEGEFLLPFDAYTGELIPDVWHKWLAHDPLMIAPTRIDALKSLSLLYMDCGTQDEFNLQLGGRQMSHLLAAHGVTHIYEEYEGGHFDVAPRYDISIPLIGKAISQ